MSYFNLESLQIRLIIFNFDYCVRVYVNNPKIRNLMNIDKDYISLI
jgi:hypothetical protein